MNNDVQILVVDDEESVRDVLSEVLSDDGYGVALAENADRAIELFNAHHFPLVITDIRMPGMSGIELLERIKSINEDTQVIVVTSHASMETARTALRAGAFDYLLKPFEALDMITKVVGSAMEKARLTTQNKRMVEELQRNNEELEKANSSLKELSIRDGLTSLFNHRHFKELLEQEVHRSRRHKRCFGLIFMDVDNFKTYNDTNGHQAGDTLLRELAQILQNPLRSVDVVGRYGGEEFVALLPETDETGTLRVAETLRSEVERHHFEGGQTQPKGKVTISVGMAVFPDNADNGKELIQKADEALYAAKNGGRNRVCKA